MINSFRFRTTKHSTYVDAILDFDLRLYSTPITCRWQADEWHCGQPPDTPNLVSSSSYVLLVVLGIPPEILIFLRSFSSTTSRHTMCSYGHRTTQWIFSVSSDSSFRVEAKLRKDIVISVNIFHVLQAAILVCPAKTETMSQPVIAWNTGIALDFSGPIAFVIWCAVM